MGMGKSLMCIPVCPTCPDHGKMVYWDPKHQTAEQRWAGTWYKCENCQSAVLFMSKELTGFTKARTSREAFRKRARFAL